MCSVKFWNRVNFTLLMVLKALGLMPLSYNIKRQCFENSSLATLYCMMCLIYFCYLFPSSNIEAIANIETNLNEVVILMTPYVATNDIVLTVIQAMQIHSRGKLVETYNKIWSYHYEITQYLAKRNISLKNITISLIVKVVIIPVILNVSLVLRLVSVSSASILAGFLFCAPMIARSVIPQFFYASLLVNRLYIKELNESIRMIMVEINLLTMHKHLQNEKEFYKIKKFCEFSDQLDEIRRRHESACIFSNLCLKVTVLPLSVVLLCNTYLIITELFAQSLSIMNTALEKIPFPSYSCFLGIVIFCCAFMEVHLFANAAELHTNEVRAVGTIFHEYELQKTDERLARSIEKFSLYILHLNFKTSIYGLFKLNRPLIHNIIATTVNVLLILVQFQLAVKFRHISERKARQLK